MTQSPRRLASIGNQNGRKTGLYSNQQPVSDEELADMARAAVAGGDHHELSRIARAVRRRGMQLRQAGQPTSTYQPYYDRAAGLRDIARQLERQAAASAADALLATHREE